MSQHRYQQRINVPEQKKPAVEKQQFRLTKELLDQVRHIDGFPLAVDEDIINLSDPPYYTACPNPFLPAFIKEHGRPYDPATDDYHRGPFAADVAEGRYNPIYNAHSYHTKVPHRAIMRYILHYTEPGDIVFDGFCGTGMTGVAAQLCDDKKEVAALGYRVSSDGIIVDDKGQPLSKLGARKAVLVDLSPAATFIAYNYNTPVDVAAFEREAKRVLAEVEEECGWMYQTQHVISGKVQKDLNGRPLFGTINYTVWSDVFLCPSCGAELVFWDVAVDKTEGTVMREFPCPSCDANLTKRELERATERIWDRDLGQVITRARQVPVLINYAVGKKRFEKQPDEFDFELIKKIEDSPIPYWYPTDILPEGEKTRDPFSVGITHVHHFHSRRNLQILAAIHHKLLNKDIDADFQKCLLLLFTSNLINISKLNRYRPKVSFPYNPLSGIIYISSQISEANVFTAFSNKIKRLAAALSKISSTNLVSTHSCSSIKLENCSIDYIFTDPPYGGNLMYSELNFLWEAWLKVFTNNKPEAIENKVQGKGLREYQHLMEKCFAECYRILKPGRWMTVVFHNSKNRVWNAIQEAIMRAGFVVADVRTLDKKQGTFNQVRIGTNAAVRQDLIVSAYKPNEGLEESFRLKAGSEEGAWDFVRSHLKRLPIVVEKDGQLEVVSERLNHLLYDRMVAFHVQWGAAVPLSAADFYAGLKQRFPERDWMFFLPAQAVEYDRVRMVADGVQQMTFLVTDEKSAIQWLRQALAKDSQTYQDIQPQFLRQFHQMKYEQIPELTQLLEENFLQDELGRWYVPDPNKQSDLERMREKALLREFDLYKEGRGRLREFRTEALRAGFKACWSAKDYRTIVQVAERIPDSVLQEDNSLYMYYDNAQVRLDE